MTLTVHPTNVQGTLPAPPSKSITHRALFAALTANGGTITRPLLSADTRASLDAIETLGAQHVTTQREITVRGGPPTGGDIDAKNSGTTLRFATAQAALSPQTSTLSGDTSLNERPMQDLIDALNELGANATCQTDGTPPITVTGPLEGNHVKVPGNISSQYASALLLAAPRIEGDLTLTIDEPIRSRPYIDLTVRILETIGVTVTENPKGTFHVEGSPQRRLRTAVPGDYSGAAFPLVAGALTKGPVTVTDLDPHAVQADARIESLLEQFGCTVTRNGDAVTVKGGSLSGANVDLADSPDLFPALCVLAAGSEGETVLEGAPHLRNKESDRIDAMVTGLNRLGVSAEALDDGARIEGGSVQGGRVESRDDHRIQMAFAVLGLIAEDPVTIEGEVDAYEVSYPGFVDAMRALGARVDAVKEAPA